MTLRWLPGPGIITIYRSPMKANIAYWTSIMREAEQELDASTTVAAMKVAAAKLMAAKVKLKGLQAKATAAEA